GAYDEGSEQRGAVGGVEPVEGASKAIVAEEFDLPWLEAKVLCDAASGPLGESGEGETSERAVGVEEADGGGGGDVCGTAAGGRQVTRQEGLELQAVEEVADDGCGANFEGFEGGMVEGGGHRCLSAGDLRRKGCYGGRREGGKKKRRSKKVLARLRAA